MPNTKVDIIGNGQIGGKGQGFINTRDAILKLNISDIDFPKSIIISTSVFKDFISHNSLDNIIKKAESDPNYNFDDLKKAFFNANFISKNKKELLNILEKFTTPIAIRSSSLLEDQKGASFAGKYESVLIGNQGSLQKREKDFFSAIKNVYASTFNPSAIAYRKKHGFVEDKEEMAILVQKIVGQKYQNYFLPAMSGVAFSQNGYCWNKEIKKSDGLVRIVFGLGTRAVGRGYVRLFSPAKPLMRPEGTEINNIVKCSQKKVDVIDLTDNTFKSIHFRSLMKDGYDCFPASQAMISLKDGNYIYRPVSNLWDSKHIPVLTMDGVLTNTWMGLNIAKTIGHLLNNLENYFNHAIDLEFAIKTDEETNKAKLYVLQMRPLSEGIGRKPKPIPADLKNEDIIFQVERNLPTSYIPNIEYLVYVDDILYRNWPHTDKQSVARVIGQINNTLKGKCFALIGPGRWGSWNSELGVPVSYSEICNTSILIEIARRKATYVPEVSFGSHFFQDLIEDNIAYLPVYPDEPNEIFNESVFSKKNILMQILEDQYYSKFEDLIKIIHVPSIFKNRHAYAILNGELEKAILFLK